MASGEIAFSSGHQGSCEGITINIFLTSTWHQTEEGIRFARRRVESTGGRVIFSTGRDPDRYVVWDSIKRRKSISG